jgi:CrcB protein
MFRNFIIVIAGGAIGSAFRYLFSLIIKHNTFPFATFTVNIIGSFLIGMIMDWLPSTLVLVNGVYFWLQEFAEVLQHSLPFHGNV